MVAKVVPKLPRAAAKNFLKKLAQLPINPSTPDYSRVAPGVLKSSKPRSNSLPAAAHNT
jgi:hypothetical protein